LQFVQGSGGTGRGKAVVFITGSFNTPLVDIEVIEGVFDKAQKAQITEDVTNAMVAIEGAGMRGVTRVRVKKVRSGEWGIGGETSSGANIEAIAAA
jgi:4-oxalocrotonate tautomerase